MAQAFNLTAQINLRGPSNIRTIVADIRRQIGTINTNINFRLDPNAARNVTQLNAGLRTLNATFGTTATAATNAANALRNFGNAVNSINARNLPQTLNAAATATSRLNQNSSQAAQSLRNASSEMQEFGKQSGLAIRRFAAFSTVSGVIYGLTNAINQGITAYIEYDKQLVKLQQVTGQSAEGLSGLESSITNLATKFGVASSDLTEVAGTLAQAGLSARDTERAMKALALSSLAPSFDNMNETVEGSIALMRQFGIGAGDLEKALGSVNAVAAKFAVESSDIIAAIQRTGGVFAAASNGVSEGTDALNEFISVFTSIRATTRESAETIATGLRTIFTRIQRGDTIEALKEYGVNLQDLDGKFVGAYNAVELLSKGLSTLDPRDIRFSKIVEELGGFRQIGKVIPLIQQFATAQDALKVAQKGQGSLAVDAAKAQESLAVQIVKVREEFLALFRDIGKSDSFQTIARGALDVTSALIKAADSVKGILPVLGVMFAFKGASAITQFTRGFTGGIRGGAARTAETQAQTGRGFASGGLVPGSGDGDTFEAKLTPGEFVMRKSAVKSIGAQNLHSMNKGGALKKYRQGGYSVSELSGSQKNTIEKYLHSNNNTSNLELDDKVDAKIIKTENKPLTNSEINYIRKGANLSDRLKQKIKIPNNRKLLVDAQQFGYKGPASEVNDGLEYSRAEKAWAQRYEGIIRRRHSLEQANIENPNYPVDTKSSSGIWGEVKFKTSREPRKSLVSKLLAKRLVDGSVNRYFKEKEPNLTDGSISPINIGELQYYGGNTGRGAESHKIQFYRQLNTGGIIQKFMAGSEGGVKTKDPTPGELALQKAAKSDIIRVLGIDKASKAAGVSASEVNKLLRIQNPDTITRAKQEAIEKEYIKAINRKAGSSQASATRMQNRGLEFAAAGMFGSAFPDQSVEINSPLLSSSPKVRMVSGIMNPKLATKLEKTLLKSSNKLAQKASKQAMISDILEKFGMGKELNLDFDRTLAFGADKILKDPRTPAFAEFGDRNKVSEALKKSKLSNLGKELVNLVKPRPELLPFMKVISARPQSTVDLIQQWLSSKGLPIPPGQFKGLGGPSVTAQNIADLKAALLSPGSLFVDDDSRNIAAAEARGDVSSYQYGAKLATPNINTDSSIQGGLLEKVIQNLGGPGSVKGLGFDFPNGLRAAAKYFDIPSDIPTDVKRTVSGPSTIKDNAVTYLKNVMGYNSGGSVRKFAKAGKVGFGTGTTEFPKRISNAYEREIKDAELKKVSEKIFNNTYSSPKNETISIDEDKVREAYDKPFDKNRFMSTFTGKIKRDSLYQDIADFTKLIGLPRENIDLALPEIIDFVPNLKSLGQFDRTGMTSRGVQSLDVSGAGFTKAHEQDLYGYKKLIEEKKKQVNKIVNTPVETYPDGSSRFDTAAARAGWGEIDTLQDNYGKISSLKSKASEQTIKDIQGKAAKTGRGSVSVRTSDPFRSSSGGGDSSTLYHEMTHQLINGLRTRNAESFTKYKERVLQLFTGDNDDLSEAFDALNSNYSSADVVYGKSYKVSNLNNIISSNKNKPGTTPDSETAHQEALGLWVKSMGIKKAREFKPLNPTINKTLLDNGLKQSYIDRIEDSGKEEFLTTLVQNSNKLDGVLSSTLDATLNELLGSAGIKRQSYAIGGRLGFKTGGVVPALVSNGEAFVPPETAKRIGYDKLNKMNKADQGGLSSFASGGISVFKGPGSGTSDSIGPIGLPEGSFILREKATKALGLHAGGAVSSFAGGGRPTLEARPENANIDTLRVSDEVVATIRELSESLQELGVSASSSSKLLEKNGDINYRQAQRVIEADIRRMRTAGATTEQIANAERRLNEIRAQATTSISTNQRFNGVSGNQLQQIETEAQRRRSLLTQRARSAGMTDDQINDQGFQDRLTNRAYRGATRAVTGASAGAGVRGDNIERYIRQSMMDRQTLAQMDRQYIGQRRQEILAQINAERGMTNNRREMLARTEEAARLAIQEVKERREIVNSAAQSRGIAGPGGMSLRDQYAGRGTLGGVFGGIGNRVMGGVNNFMQAPGRGISRALSGASNALQGNAGFFLSSALGLVAGQGEGIAGNLGYSGKDKAGAGARIESTVGTTAAGIALTSQIAPLFGPGAPFVLGIGLAATAIMSWTNGIEASKKAVKEFEQSLRTKAIEEAQDKLSKAFSELEKDPKNFAKQQQVSEALTKSSSLTAEDAAKKSQGIRDKFSSQEGFGTSISDAILYNMPFFGGVDKASERKTQKAVELSEQDKLSAKSAEPFAEAANKMIDSMVQTGTTLENIGKDPRFSSFINTIAEADAGYQTAIRTGDREAAQRIKSEIAQKALTDATRLGTEKTAAAAKAMEEANKAGYRLAISFDRMANSFDQALSKTKFDSERRTDAANSRFEAMGGKASVGNFVSRDSNVLQNPKAYDDKTKQSTFQRIAKGITGDADSEDGKAISSMLGVDTADIAKKAVAGIQDKVKNNAGDKNNMKALEGAATSQLEENIKDLPSIAKDEIRAKLKSIIESVGKDESNTPKAELLSQKIEQELGAGAIAAADKVKKMASDFASFSSDEWNKFISATNAATEAQLKAAEYSQRANDLQSNSDVSLREFKSGSSIGLVERGQMFNQRIGNLTGGTTDPNKIRNNIVNLNNQRDAEQAKINNNDTSDSDRSASVAKMADLNRQIQNNTSALDQLANSAELLNAAMQQLQEAQKMQADRLANVDKLLTSTPEELQNFNESLVRLQQRLSGVSSGPSKAARDAYNQTFRETGGNVYMAQRAGYGQMARDRGTDLQNMEQYRTTMILNKTNEINPGTGKNYTEEEATNLFTEMAQAIRQQMAQESGLAPLVGGAISTMTDPTKDFMYAQGLAGRQGALDIQKGGLQAQAQIEKDRATTLLTQSTVNLTTAFQDFIKEFRQIRIPEITEKPIERASGGIVYASSGKLVNFEPKGTDTVPAMLTPGEFVINARATAQHLPLLKSINSGENVVQSSGMSSGGIAYLAGGGKASDKPKPKLMPPSRENVYKESNRTGVPVSKIREERKEQYQTSAALEKDARRTAYQARKGKVVRPDGKPVGTSKKTAKEINDRTNDEAVTEDELRDEQSRMEREDTIRARSRSRLGLPEEKVVPLSLDNADDKDSLTQIVLNRRKNEQTIESNEREAKRVAALEKKMYSKGYSSLSKQDEKFLIDHYDKQAQKKNEAEARAQEQRLESEKKSEQFSAQLKEAAKPREIKIQTEEEKAARMKAIGAEVESDLSSYSAKRREEREEEREEESQLAPMRETSRLAYIGRITKPVTSPSGATTQFYSPGGIEEGPDGLPRLTSKYIIDNTGPNAVMKPSDITANRLSKPENFFDVEAKKTQKRESQKSAIDKQKEQRTLDIKSALSRPPFSNNPELQKELTLQNRLNPRAPALTLIDKVKNKHSMSQAHQAVYAQQDETKRKAKERVSKTLNSLGITEGVLDQARSYEGPVGTIAYAMDSILVGVEGAARTAAGKAETESKTIQAAQQRLKKHGPLEDSKNPFLQDVGNATRFTQDVLAGTAWSTVRVMGAGAAVLSSPVGDAVDYFQGNKGDDAYGPAIRERAVASVDAAIEDTQRAGTQMVRAFGPKSQKDKGLLRGQSAGSKLDQENVQRAGELGPLVSGANFMRDVAVEGLIPMPTPKGKGSIARRLDTASGAVDARNIAYNTARAKQAASIKARNAKAARVAEEADIKTGADDFFEHRDALEFLEADDPILPMPDWAKLPLPNNSGPITASGKTAPQAAKDAKAAAKATKTAQKTSASSQGPRYPAGTMSSKAAVNNKPSFFSTDVSTLTGAARKTGRAIKTVGGAVGRNAGNIGGGYAGYQAYQTAQKKSNGGIVYANNGALISARQRGTDTVPAMLTPGEFVVNRQAAQHHMPVLQAINSGHMNHGGIVKYLAQGGAVAPKYYAAAGMVSQGGGGSSSGSGGGIDVSALAQEVKNLQSSFGSLASLGETFKAAANTMMNSASTYNEAASNMPNQLAATVTNNTQVNHTGLDRLTGNIENNIYANTDKQSKQNSHSSMAQLNRNLEGGLPLMS